MNEIKRRRSEMLEAFISHLILGQNDTGGQNVTVWKGAA